MLKYFLVIILLLASPCALAETMKASDLQAHCANVQKGSVGESFDEIGANICTAYMNSFFDTMIIVDRLTGKAQFCVPLAIPTTQNTLILDAWIRDNPAIASQTTAAVALFAAFKKAFPCQPGG